MPKRRKRQQQQQPQQITPSVPQVPTEPQHCATDTSTVPTSPTPQRQPQTQPQLQQQPAVHYPPLTPAQVDEILSMNPVEQEMVQRARLDEALAGHFESLDRQKAQAAEQYRQMVSNHQQSRRQLMDEAVGPGMVEYKQVGPPKRGRPVLTPANKAHLRMARPMSPGEKARLYRRLGLPTDR